MARAKAKKFPYTAFTLSNSMIVREITLVKKSTWGESWHMCDKDRRHHTGTLYDTRDLAIAAGEVALKAREIRVNTTLANLAKHKANLAKAKEQKGK